MISTSSWMVTTSGCAWHGWKRRLRRRCLRNSGRESSSSATTRKVARRGLTRLRSRAAFWRKARPSPRTSSPWLKLNGGRRPNKFWRSTRPCGRPGRRARFRAVRRFPLRRPIRHQASTGIRRDRQATRAGLGCWRCCLEAQLCGACRQYPSGLPVPALDPGHGTGLGRDYACHCASPRSVDPRFEFDAFAACLLPSTADVERAAREALAKGADRP